VRKLAPPRGQCGEAGAGRGEACTAGMYSRSEGSYQWMACTSATILRVHSTQHIQQLVAIMKLTPGGTHHPGREVFSSTLQLKGMQKRAVLAWFLPLQTETSPLTMLAKEVLEHVVCVPTHSSKGALCASCPVAAMPAAAGAHRRGSSAGRAQPV
jgi:hypothetical protein